MRSTSYRSHGFTLIASLLLLLLLSGIAIGLMMMVTTEAKVGGADLQNNIAYHSAEGGIEKMTSDLSGAFQNAQSPSASQICNLSNQPPSLPGVTWADYSVAPYSVTTGLPVCAGNLAADNGTVSPGQITSGPNQGLFAQIIPVKMLATAVEPGGQQVSMQRQAQVALIPVFQFGVFCEGDCSFYSGPNFDFAGRVHTNGDLYPEVGPGSTLTFHDRLTVWGNVVRAMLPNGFSTGSNYNGTVKIPTTSGGCDGPNPPVSTCRPLGLTDGSVTGAGGNPPQSSQNPNWQNLSVSTYMNEIIDGDYGLKTCGVGGASPCGTGAKKLSLPFVNGTTHPYEIIRRPPVAGESATSALAQSREYNLAQIRVLLSDNPAELPGGAGDAANIRLSNSTNPGPDYTRGVPVPIAGNPTWTTYFAEGTTSTAVNDMTGYAQCLTGPQLAALNATPDWPLAPADAGAYQTLMPTAPKAPLLAAAGTWNLLDGYLRVEYKDAAGNWNPVTKEWLELGFARGLTPPTSGGPNPVHPNAILIFQQPADRDGSGTIDPAGTGCLNPTPKARPAELLADSTTGSLFYGDNSQPNSETRNNWYPINFYDVREGEVRDTAAAAPNSCTANGVMNAVEIDVGNLKKWLTGAIGASGTSVDNQVQNGYVLYFSDRRGMLPNPNPPCSGQKCGDSGLEDVINRSSAVGTPDGVLDNSVSPSPEDVNQNGALDNYGARNLGLGLYGTGGVATQNLNAKIVTAAPALNPYIRIDSCSTTGRKNWVSGARHVLRLVNGSLGNVPMNPDNKTGGFTVASENPVYVLGNYNSSQADTIWTAGTDEPTGHAAAAVIADAVTVLSNNWTDLHSFAVPTSYGSRQAQNTWYRLAIAGGKNLNFPQPTWGASQDFGTDGGTHNFLRYLENWGGKTLNYKGSLISMYYATYATGIFKCCTIVYSPPTRNYSFDSDFTSPAGLPPGTPMFRDVDSLGYRQIFTARQN